MNVTIDLGQVLQGIAAILVAIGLVGSTFILPWKALRASQRSTTVSEKNAVTLKTVTDKVDGVKVQADETKAVVDGVKLQTDGLTAGAVAAALAQGTAEGNVVGRKEVAAEIREADETVDHIPNRPHT